jgi:hypothetical protein
MLHATTALYTHTVAKEKPVQLPEKEKKEEDKVSGWYRWRNSALQMYGINYRFSKLVLEERDTSPQDPEDVVAHAYSGYEGIGTLLAGDRAPEAPELVLGGTETPLLGLFKLNFHTVLVFHGEGDAKIVEVATKYPKDAVQVFVVSKKEIGSVVGGANVLVDRGAHAHNAYLVEEGVGTVVIVRPDGFIGAIVPDERGVERYMRMIFKV